MDVIMENSVLFTTDVIAILMALILVKLLSSALSGVNFTDEVSVKDNSAYGIVAAATFLAVGILLSGVQSGDYEHSVMAELLSMGSYLLTGIVLMTLSRVVFDRLLLSQVSLKQEVLKGNTAAALTDAANVICSALIMAGIMHWVDAGSLLADLPYMIGAWLLSHIVLSAAIKYRLARSLSKGVNLQDEVAKNNLPVAIRFAGYRIATAMAISTTGLLVDFDADYTVYMTIDWVLYSSILATALYLASQVVKKVVSPNVDYQHEVEVDKNIGVAFIEAAIFMATAISLTALITPIS